MAVQKLYPREAAYKHFGPKYRCAYCGEPSDTIDHTVPRWFVNSNWRVIARCTLVKVSACRECNTLLGNKLDLTWGQRKARLAKAVARRGKKLLMVADWNEEEIAEMGRFLQRHLHVAASDARALRRRLEYLANFHWPETVPQSLWGDAETAYEGFGDDN